MTQKTGIIADDFTGSTDVGGLLVRQGLRVRLHIGTPGGDDDGTDCDVHVIALKCRTIPADAAVAQSMDALDWLRDAGCGQIYWKYCSTFDSTAAGNIGPVTDALMDRLGTDRTVICPAFPENGRRVFQGHLFVHDQLLHDSPMKDHPLTPMRDSRLASLLAPQVKGQCVALYHQTVSAGPAAIMAHLDGGDHHGKRHYIIADAASDGDLSALADALRSLPLLTGGSAFAGACYRRSGAGAAQKARWLFGNGPAVVLSGSCSAATRRQVSAMRGTGCPVYDIDPTLLAQQGTGDLLDWIARVSATAPAFLIAATTDADQLAIQQARLGVAQSAQLVEDAMAQAAICARQQGAARLIVAGGETSGAVTRALQLNRLDIGPEIAPGVPWCFASDSAGDFALALKSGNFGKDDFFLQVVQTETIG